MALNHKHCIKLGGSFNHEFKTKEDEVLDEVLVHGVDGITSFVTGVKMKHTGTRIDTV